MSNVLKKDRPNSAEYKELQSELAEAEKKARQADDEYLLAKGHDIPLKFTAYDVALKKVCKIEKRMRNYMRCGNQYKDLEVNIYEHI